MFDAMGATAPPAPDTWVYLAAVRALDDALDALGASSDELRRLQAEATWQAKGVARLRMALIVHTSALAGQSDRVGALRHAAYSASVV